MIGPDLLGVTDRREKSWLIRWIVEPDKMLKEKDPIAIDLLKQFNQIPMPNLGVSETEAQNVLEHIASQSAHATKSPETNLLESAAVAASSSNPPVRGGFGGAQLAALIVFLILTAIIIFVFWLVARSTRQPVPVIDMKSAYKLRKQFFFGATVIVLGTLAATLPRTPYPDDFQTPDHLVYVTARQFNFLYSSEPITNDTDLGQVALINSLEIPVEALIEFRVTSLDVNHGFAIYGPDHSIVAQTQAMPGYTNRLRVRFLTPGTYNVLCLEYCGAAHHFMRTAFVVR